MYRKVFITFVATVALSAGIAEMTSPAEAKQNHHRNRHDDGLPLSFFAFPGYGFHSPAYYYDYQDCGYRRVAVKKWNKAHTKRIKVYKKRWVCY